ncbi:alpha/beta fold hydrolase [Halopseudomonas laoshanensis]|uniref:alpha/beta fold hydrolase n=1 Tax=Halopseudomonas laoshanensis TaxID=2268758 RepID=UPI00373554AD
MPAKLIDHPANGAAHATLLFAHGAGALMDSEFMQLMATLLSQQGLDVVRFEFPYMQTRRLEGKKRPPDPMPRLLDAYREQCGLHRGPLFIAGKSMGGRVASMLVDELPVAGAVCFGYPFHPPGKPEKTRIAHLQNLRRPLLVLQGTRDPLGKPYEVAEYPLSERLELKWLDSADHDFKPLKASGLTQQDVIAHAARLAGEFCRQHLPGSIVSTG